MFWIICAALTGIVGLAIAAPLLRARPDAAQPAAAFDLQVYRDQLREVDRDLERGVIGADDAIRLRTEIGRKVLDADRRLSQSAGALRGRGGLAVAVLAVMLAGGVFLYLREGQPGRADLPIGQRIAQADRLYATRPSQTEAEANAPRQPAPDLPPEYADLMRQLREAVARNPADPEGLTLLAQNELRLGNVVAARQAQQRLVDLRGDQVTAAELVRLSALMAEAAGGIITPEAEAVLVRALQADPTDPQGRYLLGMLQLQNDRPDRAFPVWRRLLEEGPETAPWIAPIRAAIGDLAWLAGQPDYTPPAAMPGPDAEAMAAAEDLSPQDRRQMIEGMVRQLEARLADQGGPPEEWARLIASLMVIGDRDHAADILAEAEALFATRPEGLEIIRQAAARAGLVQ